MTLRYFCLIVLAGGTVYVCIELLWRGRSHWSMFLDSGLCAALIGMLNEWAPGLPLSAQALLGACVITGSELVFGSLFNRSYAVWDYRGLPHNVRGQICPQYFCAWLFIALLAVLLDDGLRLGSRRAAAAVPLILIPRTPRPGRGPSRARRAARYAAAPPVHRP